MNSAAPDAPEKLLGRTEARLFTEPLRPLTRDTTRGFEVIDFAEMIGQPLLPWQEWAVKHALELNHDGTYRFKTVVILVARQNGKSSLKRTVSLWRMYMDGAKYILGVAQDTSQAKYQMELCIAAIRESPDLLTEWEGDSRAAGNEWFAASGCRYTIKASNRRAGRGGSNDEVNIDELREQRDWDAWGAISKTTMARANGQVWCMSNAGDDQSVVLNQLRDAALSGQDETICLLEWSAPDGCEVDDREGWAQANPGLGYIIGEQSIRSAMGTDPPGVFRCEVLCQRVVNLDNAINLEAWKACADPTGNMNGFRDRLALSFDIAPDEKHCTLVAAGVLDDGRIRVEVVKDWRTTDEARDELPELLDRLKPIAVAWYPVGPGAAFGPLLRKQKGSLELSGSKVTEACQGLADLVLGRRVLHAAQSGMDAQIAGASRLSSGDGWRFTRRGQGHVDTAYACAGAVFAAQTIPPPARARVRVAVF